MALYEGQVHTNTRSSSLYLCRSTCTIYSATSSRSASSLATEYGGSKDGRLSLPLRVCAIRYVYKVLTIACQCLLACSRLFVSPVCGLLGSSCPTYVVWGVIAVVVDSIN